MAGVEKATETTIVTKTGESEIDNGTTKMDGTPTVEVNGENKIIGVPGDAPENRSEVKDEGKKVEVTDIKKDGEAEDTAVAKEKADVSVAKNESEDGKAEGNTEVVLEGKKEEPSNTAAEVVPTENSGTVVEENTAPEEKSVENGNLQLSEAATETHSDDKSEPGVKEMKVEPVTVSQIETTAQTNGL